MAITLSDARGQYTKSVLRIYRELSQPTSFLKSFFAEKTYGTKEVSIEVERGSELVAADVFRGSDGNRNSFDLSTEKIWVPPMFREYFDATNLRIYQLALGAKDPSMIVQLAGETAEKLAKLKAKIERAIELQCSQVFNTGIVTLTSGDNIDFKRKAGSLVDVSGSNPWATGTNDPIVDLQNGCDFLRGTGKAQGGVVDAIMGATAFNNLLNNTTFQARADIKSFNLDTLRAPVKNSVGAVPHGSVSVGSYLVRIWTYPETYDVSGTPTAYVDAKNVVMIPEGAEFDLAYAMVPKLITSGIPAPASFFYGEYTDERKSSHIFDVQSAPLAVPTAVDKIYTVQVVA